MTAPRHRLGQWFTPPAVADLALSLALEGRRPRRLLDATCGDGAFLARAAARGLDPARLAGIEVDPAVAAAARAQVPGAAIECRDLFSAEAGELCADVIVGNPPYVRPERLGAGLRQRIRERLAADWPELPGPELDRLCGRGDLAALCIARVLRLLERGGRAALVVSTALLDAGYARPLWRLIAAEGRVVALVEAPRERWFRDAAVNACILVFERARAARPVTLARLTADTADAAARVRSAADLGQVAELRRGPSLAADADAAARWAALLRAPAAWFSVAEAAGAALVPLSELATVRRGVTSGANDFFYLPRREAAALGIEAAALRPLLRSPREAGAQRIEVDLADTAHLALCLPADDSVLAGLPGAARYLAARAEVSGRRTLRAREPWWTLPARPARLFLAKSYAARFVQRLAPEPVVADQRLYALSPRAGVDPAALCAALNSSFTALALESLGRASLGEGALEWTVGDAQRLPVLDPRGREEALIAALAPLRRRDIGDVAAEAGRTDRAALDRAAAPALAEHLPAVHAALVESTERRARRARSGAD